MMKNLLRIITVCTYWTLIEQNLLAEWWSSAYCQQYGPGVFQGAERQADLCAERQRQSAQLHVSWLGETHRVQVLWDRDHNGCSLYSF